MNGLDPTNAARVEELKAAGRLSGDAIGIAQWEQEHADDRPAWADDEDDEERR